ncbi:MAG TPA: hypothetical protein PK466_14930, partial [Thermotogota bacterium]|nr:hypothetical protein [Thermotogota bacterium]
ESIPRLNDYARCKFSVNYNSSNCNIMMCDLSGFLVVSRFLYQPLAIDSDQMTDVEIDGLALLKPLLIRILT